MRRLSHSFVLASSGIACPSSAPPFFWEASDNPETPQNGNLACGLLFNDLSGIDGVVGHTIREVNYEASQSGDVGLTVRFSSGKQLTFKYSCEAVATQLVGQPSSDLDRG